MIPQIAERREEAHDELRRLGETEATLKWSFEHHEAVALTHAREQFRDEKSAKEDRESWAKLYVFVADDFPGGIPEPSFVGFTLCDVGLARDLAVNAYANQNRLVTTLAGQADTLRTLEVSARQAP